MEENVFKLPSAPTKPKTEEIQTEDLEFAVPESPVVSKDDKTIQKGNQKFSSLNIECCLYFGPFRRSGSNPTRTSRKCKLFRTEMGRISKS